MRLFGVLLGLSGGLLLATSKAFASDVALVLAALILVMPLFLALGNIYRTLCWPEGAEPLYLAALMMKVGAIALLAFALTTEPGQLPVLFASTSVFKLLVLEIAVFSVLYLVFFVLQRIAGPVYLSQMGTVAAVVGTVISILGLGESPPPNFIIAFALVGLGTIAFHLSTSRSMPIVKPAVSPCPPGGQWRG